MSSYRSLCLAGSLVAVAVAGCATGASADGDGGLVDPADAPSGGRADADPFIPDAAMHPDPDAAPLPPDAAPPPDAPPGTPDAAALPPDACVDMTINLLANPKEWQAEMDRRGVQTATVFHWWGNHQPLLQYLLKERRWDVVGYDETTVVFVRHEGNTETIGRAALAFLQQREATERTLLETTRSWQWQLGRIRGNKAYQRLLMWMGKPEEARPFRENMTRLSERRG